MKVAVIGYGGVGKATAIALRALGDAVRVAHRHRPENLPTDVEYCQCDMLNPHQVSEACAGMDAIVFCAAPPYVSKLWARDFGPALANVLAGCENANARFVFADNLYMYGPVDGMLTENAALTDYGVKPKVRAELTRQWVQAHLSGLVKGVAVRASDYYGPDTAASVVGLLMIAPVVKGKKATLIYDPDMPHALTYIGDFARALVTLVHAPDDAYGRAWHVPNAPALTPRELLAILSDVASTEARTIRLPRFMLRVAGLVDPVVGSLYEMSFQRDRPYLVDDTDFRVRFWSDHTAIADGLTKTVAFERSK